MPLKDELAALYIARSQELQETYQRDLPFQDAMFDRWERAERLGFGAKSNIYNSAFVFGKITVGENVWIGPGVMLDGSAASVTIGDGCTIAANVHIYTHDNILKTLSGGTLPMATGPVSIGDNTYIGSQSIINKNVTIGAQCVIAANSFVNSNVPDRTIMAGNPAKKIGMITVDSDKIELVYGELSNGQD